MYSEVVLKDAALAQLCRGLRLKELTLRNDSRTRGNRFKDELLRDRNKTPRREAKVISAKPIARLQYSL